MQNGWGSVAAGPVPLRVMYILAPHLDGSRSTEIIELGPVRACLELQVATYLSDILWGPTAERALDASARLASAVSVRRVSYCRSYENLPQLRRALLDDAASIATD